MASIPKVEKYKVCTLENSHTTCNIFKLLEKSLILFCLQDLLS